MTAQEILNQPFSSYKYMTSVRHICLPPRYLGNVTQGIRDQLDSEINFYCSDLESVVISYDKLKLLQAVGSILDDSPFLHFKIQADYIVFKPTIGCILKGIVNKVSKDHVGCLVHDRFNASIHRPRQNVNGWRGSQLQEGEEFPFEVQDIYSNNAVISLKGKLVDHKVIEAYLQSLKVENNSDKSKKDNNKTGDYVDTDEGEITLENEPVLVKKRKRTTSNQAQELHDTVDGDGKTDVDNNMSSLSTPKKKKKRSHKKEIVETFDKRKTSSFEGDWEVETPTFGKKRKHSLEAGNCSILQQGSDLSSSKKVRFNESILDSSPDTKKKMRKKALISPIGVNDGGEAVHDGSYLDSSVFEESPPRKHLKQKKKHKRNDGDLGQEEEMEWTGLKSMSELVDSDLNVKKKKKKKKERKDSEVTDSESSGGQSLVLSGLAEGFGKIFSDLQTSQKSKKKKNKEKDLMDVVLELQSEVTKAATKLMTSNSGNKKKKQKKKKNRDSSSSSPERDLATETPKKSKRTSESFVLNTKDRSVESVDSDESMNISGSDSDFKICDSASIPQETEGISKKKKKKKKQK